MKAKDTGSSDWPEGEPSAEQKVTLEDYQQLIIQMRKANVKVQFTQTGKELIIEEFEKCCKLLERVKERMGEKDMYKFLYYYSQFCTILVDEIF